MVFKVIDCAMTWTIRGLVLLMIVMFVVGCQTPAGNFCDIERPMRLSDATIDAMTDAEIARVLAFNEKGRAMCGWRP